MKPDVPTDHEYDGIHEFDNPLPRWWLMTFAGTVVFAVIYWVIMHSLPTATSSFDRYGEDQRQYDLAAAANAIDPATVEAMAKDPSVVAAGKTIFTNRCVSCHGPEGGGAVGPNLTDNYWIHGGDLKSIYITVSGGYPKLGMPEWRAVLEDKDIATVVAFLQSIRNTNVPGKPPQGELFTAKAP
ncbi:MAG: cbb3-type cytochrome c oxidase N-terminal domain-containing protein [Myxococcota bacterium]